MLFWVIAILAYVVGVVFVLAMCNASKRGTADMPDLRAEVHFENLEQELRALDRTHIAETSEKQKVAEPVA